MTSRQAAGFITTVATTITKLRMKMSCHTPNRSPIHVIVA